MVIKIENENEPILRLHTQFENNWSVHGRTLAQNVRARPVFHRRSYLRVWSLMTLFSMFWTITGVCIPGLDCQKLLEILSNPNRRQRYDSG